jgi:hypothetical protein
MLKQGANLCDVVLLALALAIGNNLTTGAQRIDICLGYGSHLSLDSHAPNPPYPRGHLFSYDHLLRPAAMKRLFVLDDLQMHDSPAGMVDEVLRRCWAEQMIAGGKGARGGREGFGRLRQATGVMRLLDKYRFAVPRSLLQRLWPRSPRARRRRGGSRPV